jgi:protein-S-isoprenylcysteine O-methyltransferase Ste14/NAD-dependent dihydropyrimidine dehydrogenase PreA subunit
MKPGCGTSPIDPDFRKKRQKVGEERGIAIWGPVDPPERLGIRGTNVAVDWDICTGCGACIEACPHRIFEWVQSPGHPTSGKKAFPSRESECPQCFRCEARCSVGAIRTTYRGQGAWEDLLGWVSFISAFLQPIGGVLYGLLFGPALGIGTLFHAGWVVLVLGLLFVVVSLVWFRRRGHTLEGRGIMSTTVLVDSGPYGIIRHPQFFGISLVACGAVLISQHWLFLLMALPLLGLFPKWTKQSEAGLIAKFGDEYRRYMQKVPRTNLLLGIIRLLRRRGEGS